LWLPYVGHALSCYSRTPHERRTAAEYKAAPQDYDAGMNDSLSSRSSRPVVPSLEAEPENSSRVVLGVVLCLVFILVRGQGLLALPMFSDEAIYLRWAQLVRAGHPWVSLIDPKPPLHFWMLAGVWGWARDPLLAARGLSVFAGVVSIPGLMLMCEELGLLQRERATNRTAGPAPSGRILGLLAAVLMIFCPFLAFYQRLATADALFVAEMLMAGWLGLCWGRRVMTGLRAWPAAMALGVAMGAAMMTRQGLSYTLWGIPVAGVALHFSRGVAKRRWGRVLMQFVLAVVVAMVLWLPYLTTELPRFTENARAEAAQPADVSGWTVVKQRILYQEQFTEAGDSRLALAAKNAESAGVWFFDYLTWPVLAASVLGLAAIALRRQWRLLVLLLVWLGLMLGPVIVLGNVVYSRYVLAGAPALLIAAAYFVAEVLTWALSTRLWPVLTWTGAGVILAAILLLPLRQIVLQATRWWEQTLTAADRAQYITGWTSGRATQKALTFLKGYAAGGEVVVITDNGWGLPADAAWVALEGTPHVRLYYKTGASESPILMPSAEHPGAFMLRKDKWLYTPPEPVEIPADASVLFLTQAHGGAGGDDALLESLRRFTPNLKPVLSFYGIDNGPEHVILLEVK
jgi:4-amino-4-deoxy-L-arabinose transferase-like glycosyltransferase